MKIHIIVGILATLLVMVFTAVVFAAHHTQTQAKPLTKVTVAVTGFHCQGCPDELQRDLAKLKGVTDVKATLQPAQVTAKLDEEQITASQFVNAIAAHPTGMDRKKTYGATLLAYIDTPMCAKQQTMCEACFPELQKRLTAVSGVKTVALDKTGKIASISFKPDTKLDTNAINKALSESDFHFTVSFTEPVKAAESADPHSSTYESTHNH